MKLTVHGGVSQYSVLIRNGTYEITNVTVRPPRRWDTEAQGLRPTEAAEKAVQLIKSVDEPIRDIECDVPGVAEKILDSLG